MHNLHVLAPSDRKWFVISVCCCLLTLLLSTHLNGEEALARIDQVRNQITDTESLMTQTESEHEKASLQKRLDRLHKELELLEKKKALENKELDLSRVMLSKPENALLDIIRSIDRSVGHLEEQQDKLQSELADLQTLRDATILERRQIEKADEESQLRAAELDEKLFSIREGITALNTESEAISHEMRIATEIQRIRASMKSAKEQARIHFRMILDIKRAIEHDKEQRELGAALLENLTESYHVTSEKLELGRQKLAQIDDEIDLLNSQIGIFKSNPEIVNQRNIARSQKEFLGEELKYIERQVAAIDRSKLAVSRLNSLVEKEYDWLENSYGKAIRDYIRLWLFPLLLIFSFIAIYFFLSRFVFPRLEIQENLMILRRFSRYIVILSCITVVICVLFEDMQGFFTVLGIISAGLVIALQDVCTAIAGWFTILTGGKFTVGDRIEVDGSVGDVIDIDLLRTTIIEINADLEQEHPTGRVIVLPNSFVLRSKVANASHGHPFKWCKEVITFTYESDFEACEALLKRVIHEETANNFTEARLASNKIRQLYGITDADYEPKVYTHLADSGYEFSCLHVCNIKQIGITRSKIHRRLAEELKGLKDVELAYPTAREIHSIMEPSKPISGPSDRS